jgi:hypothetical protein
LLNLHRILDATGLTFCDGAELDWRGWRW